MNKDTKNLVKRLLIIALVFVSGVIGVSRLFDIDDFASKGDNVEIVVKATGEDLMDDEHLSGNDEQTTMVLFPVHIAGAVNKAGVYYVSKGTIVNDVIDMAGGATKEADLSLINLAESVYAGMKIMVYKEGEEVIIGTQSTGLVNINTADKTALMTLPGIGESKAESIIEYRKEHGPFEKIEDIMNIAGIKEAMYNKIKNRITV